MRERAGKRTVFFFSVTKFDEVFNATCDGPPNLVQRRLSKKGRNTDLSRSRTNGEEKQGLCSFLNPSIHFTCWCLFDFFFFFFFFFFLSAKNASVMGSKQEPLSPPRLQDLLDLDPSLAPHAQTITNRLECACVSLIPSHDRERQAHMHTHAHTHAHSQV